MNCILRIIFSIIIFTTAGITQAAPKPIVEIDTNMGKIVVELNHRRAPTTVNNFLKYVKKGFYNGTIFHRVIPGFMIQGGGFTVELSEKPTRAPIRNESTNGLSNSMGTIAMARTQEVDSATSQFYINVNDNRSLDATYGKPGYAVFGNVIEGEDIAIKISEVDVKSDMRAGDNLPIEPIVIKSITLLKTKSTTSSDKKSEKSKSNKEK